jgi:hypothetical protein
MGSVAFVLSGERPTVRICTSILARHDGNLEMMPGSANLNIGVYLWVATHYGPALSRLASHKSDEIVLLTTFVTVLVAASVTELVHVSPAIGAFLVGIAAPGPIAETVATPSLVPPRSVRLKLFPYLVTLQSLLARMNNLSSRRNGLTTTIIELRREKKNWIV